MSSLYRFDVNVSPIAMYEWEDEQWTQKTLSLNESLTLNGDNTITLLKIHKNFEQTKTFAVTPSTEDAADVYYKVDDDLTLGDDRDTVEYNDAPAGIKVNLAGGGRGALGLVKNAVGSDYADTLIGSAGSNELVGGAGNDTVNGGNGNDLIIDTTGSGNDKYVGGGGSDTVDYSSALAAITVNLLAGRAASTLDDAGIGTDTLAGVENVVGGAFDDSLTGSALANRLDGGDGNDTLAGGLGKDTLVGGLGADVFRFGKAVDAGLGLKSDVIADFDGASGDLIDLSAIDAKASVAGNDAFTLLAEAPVPGGASGVLWFVDGVLYGSTDNDVAAEFQIELTGVTSLAAENLVV